MASGGHELRVGEELVLESRPSAPPFCVVLEDDGDTGYLYALDFRRGDDQPIFDALHIYDVHDVVDRDRPSELTFGWTEDERAVALFINGHPHAAVDFAEPRLMCRTGFPPPGAESPVSTHEWDDAWFAQRFGG